MQAVGAIDLSVGGEGVGRGKTLGYKGVMMAGVPNLGSVFGYINASWTLKADLICNYVCRLLNLMDRKGVLQVTPKDRGESAAAPFIENFTSGYIQRALSSWPKQGARKPWRGYQNYFRDAISLKWTPLDDGALELSNPPQPSSNPKFAAGAEANPASLSVVG